MQTELTSRTYQTGKSVLVIDDDDLFCDTLTDYLGPRGLSVVKANTCEEGLDAAARDRVDVVLLDQRLPDCVGQELCPSLLKSNERAKILMVTAHATQDEGVQALRAGAHDYLSKPIGLEELHQALRQALRLSELERLAELEWYRRKKDSQQTRLVGFNGALAEVGRMIDVAADTDAPVLITGETGTGKTAAAKDIHYRGNRRHGPFIPLNCAALPENLIESDLFGYDKGAFTGAEKVHRGVFEMAEGGTLLLDEIAEMPLHLQSKLLSVIEDLQVRRLGGEHYRPVDVRVITATAVDLDSAVGETFREDLYYRLGVVRIHMLPLRERLADLPALCEHLLGTSSLGTRARLGADEVARLSRYYWPGNVRELKNVLERAVLLQAGPELEPSKLLATRNGDATKDQQGDGRTACATPCIECDQRELSEVEREYILHILDRNDYNYSRTARVLGIGLSTLKRRLDKYGMR